MFEWVDAEFPPRAHEIIARLKRERETLLQMVRGSSIDFATAELMREVGELKELTRVLSDGLQAANARGPGGRHGPNPVVAAFVILLVVFLAWKSFSG